MPVPSACGYPDTTNTGPDPTIPRTAVSGTVTLSTPGQVYENKTLNGDIVVTALNVTIRNVKINHAFGSGYHMISVMPGGSWDRADANLTVENVEFDMGGQIGVCTGSGCGDFQPIAYNGFTVRRSYFHDGSDCAAVSENVSITDSLCAVGYDANDNGWPDGGANDGGVANTSPSWCNGPQHFDGLQSDGGNGITIRHNTIRNPCGQTSNVLMSSNTSHISNATISDNLFAGGGYSLYCAGDDFPSHVDHIVATGNRFARTYWPNSGFYGPTTHCESSFATFTGNVWDDTGASLGS